ncbi:MAG: hypothetical protein ACRC6F_05090, partial [Aeromonas sp.]
MTKYKGKRKSSDVCQDETKKSRLTSSPLPISAGPPTPAPTVPEPLVTSQSDLFAHLVLVDIEDEDEVHIISPFGLKDTRHRKPKPMRKKQPKFSWMEENTVML